MVYTGFVRLKMGHMARFCEHGYESFFFHNEQGTCLQVYRTLASQGGLCFMIGYWSLSIKIRDRYLRKVKPAYDGTQRIMKII